MSYIDGFVIPVPKDKVEDYRAIARSAGEVWKEAGALAYVEAVADDVPYGERTSFPRAVQATEDEVVVFSWIVFESREARDTINTRVMADERLQKIMNSIPVDMARMIYGGFTPLIEL